MGQISPASEPDAHSPCISLPGFCSAFSIASTHLNLVMPTSGLTHRPILLSLVTTDCKLRQPGVRKYSSRGPFQSRPIFALTGGTPSSFSLQAVDKSKNFNSLVTVVVDLAQLDSLGAESVIRETCPALVNRSSLYCTDAHRSFAIIRRDYFGRRGCFGRIGQDEHEHVRGNDSLI
jgi:hypothetical protein